MLQKLISLSALLRLPNLLILAISVYIYSFNILYPSLALGGMHGSLRFKDFALLLFIVICTGAGGYIHNDILDRKSDHINEKRGIIGHQITLSMAWVFYWFVVIAPIPFVYSLSLEINNLSFVLGYLFVSFILFAYNGFLKRLPLIGNITVALLCTYVFLLPAHIELAKIQSLQSINTPAFQNCLLITLSFAFFVFLTHTIRELVKDAEDQVGDRQSGFKTLPVLISHRNLTILLLSLEFVLLIGIILWLSTFFISSIYFWIHVILLLPLTVYILILTYKSSIKTDFSNLSLQCKYLMLAGMVSLSICNI